MTALRLRRGHAAVVSAMLLQAACGSVRYPQLYVLEPRPPAPVVNHATSGAGPLIVRDFECPSYLCDGRIVYRPTANEIGYYEYHRWAMSPRRMIADAVATEIRSRALFSAVVLRDADPAASYQLAGSIDRLEEVDRGRDVQVVCELTARLVDLRTHSIVWSTSASSDRPVTDRSVAGVVAALTSAMRETVDSLVESISTQLAADALER